MIYKYIKTEYANSSLLMRNARYFNLLDASQREFDVAKELIIKLARNEYYKHKISRDERFMNLEFRGTMREMEESIPVLAVFKHFWADYFDGEIFKREKRHEYYYNFYICSFSKSVNRCLNCKYPSPERGDGVRLLIDDTLLTRCIPRNDIGGIDLHKHINKAVRNSKNKKNLHEIQDKSITVYLYDVSYNEKAVSKVLSKEINEMFTQLQEEYPDEALPGKIIDLLLVKFNSFFYKWIIRAITLKPKYPFKCEDEIRLIIQMTGSYDDNNVCTKYYLPDTGLYFTFCYAPKSGRPDSNPYSDYCFRLHYTDDSGFITGVHC